VEAAPYIPEVVYPSMSRTTRAPLRNISRNHEAGYPARGEGISSAPYFRGTSSKRRVVAAAQRQYSVNFPVLPISSETTSGESRVILAPIDGEKYGKRLQIADLTDDVQYCIVHPTQYSEFTQWTSMSSCRVKLWTPTGRHRLSRLS
ncbi:hypothetical protein AAVH_33731, partial [Aphelenchoides avenae]